jgi:hypothetical protein
MSIFASSQGNAPVDRIDIPDEPAPSLHAHPSEQALHGYYEPVRQRDAASVLSAFGFCLGTLPLATRANDPTPPYRRSPSHVPYKSRRPGSRRLYAGHHLANTRAPAKLNSRGKNQDLDFDAI